MVPLKFSGLKGKGKMSLAESNTSQLPSSPCRMICMADPCAISVSFNTCRQAPQGLTSFRSALAVTAMAEIHAPGAMDAAVAIAVRSAQRHMLYAAFS